MLPQPNSDRYLISTLLLILAGLIVWLSVHMGWLGQSFKKQTNQQPAGYIYESYNQLRRKSVDGLKWEKAHLNEEVFNFDSIMTLEKSQATIRLNNNAEIHLAENTMVTIEPASSGISGDIRMRLSQGNFRATGGDKATKIETDNGVITLDPNSEVRVQQSAADGLKIEVTKDFYLLSPSPREIVKTNQDVIFSWTPLEGAENYRLVFLAADGKNYFEKVIRGNSFPYRFKESVGIQWKVVGLDKAGKALRSSEVQPISAESQPFEAPEVEEPELRLPSQAPSSWWIKILLPRAEAAEKLEAVFAWKPIAGADFYNIEVSKTADFKAPLLAQKISQNQFVWTGFVPGIYYWRVAAASVSGRSGVFTKPTLVDLNKISEAAAPVDGVLVRRSLELEAQRTEVDTNTDKVLTNKPTVQFDEQAFASPATVENPDARDLRSRYFFQALGSAAGWTLNNERQQKAELDSKSSTSSGAQIHTEHEFQNNRSVVFDLSYMRHTLMPKIGISNPLTKEQSFDDMKGKILFGNNKSNLTRGIVAQTIPVLENAEIKSETAGGVGVLFLAGQDESRWKNSFALDFVAGASLFALSMQNQARYHYATWENSALSLGFNAQAEVISIRSSTSYRWNAGLTLGLEFY
jgi:hypothetical protein